MKEKITKEQRAERVAKLRMRQAMPLDLKIKFSERRIKEWYEAHNGLVSVSFSGGKDSTALLHLVRSLYPEVPAVFSDTGLEYPEIRDFVKKIDNVVWVKPKVPFNKVIEKYGYPVVSKRVAQYVGEVQNTKSSNMIRLRTTGIRKDGTRSPLAMISKKWQGLINAPFKVSGACCKHIKKDPLNKYVKETGRVPYIGTMASDGAQRKKTYLEYGCNSFDQKDQRSTPIAFWMEEDVWEYLRSMGVPYCSIYDQGFKRTGCMFCMFGIQFDEKYNNRFHKMARTHPDQYKYCMGELGMAEVLDFIGVSYTETDAKQTSLFAFKEKTNE